MRTTRILVATAIATLTACGGGGDTPTITTPTPPVVAAVASVTVTPDAMQLLAPATLQLTAAMKDAAGNGLTNRAVAWSTSQAVVATVSADGMVTALGPGTTVVTATSEGRSGNATITVTAPPSALSVSQGSGQTGEPGLALPIRPAVIVRDAQARPVANVSVTFVIDSGGGSLASTQATSGSDGVATAGVWTLGQSEGRNVVLATTTGLAGVRVTATGTYPNVAIGQSQVSLAGGVITVARPGSALNGMRVEIPDSAFLSPVSMTIRQRSSAGLALQEPGPAALLRPVSNAFALAAGGAPAITPIITIVTNGPPSASGELLLKVPVPIGTISPRVAVVDSVGTPVAFLPIVASDSTSVTVTTRALSTSVLTQIGNIPQTLPSGSQSLSIVLFAGRAGSSLAQLYPYSFGVGFTHGVHNLGFYDLKTTYETQ
ncbi:MAG: Ig-like domain-containing protein, partial [Gemmatimonas sp.]